MATVPTLKPSRHHVPQAIHLRATISAPVAGKVNALARRFGIRRNRLGCVVNLLIDAMVDAGRSAQVQRTYGRLDPEHVRAIRASREKFASLAAEYRISEAMVAKVRARRVYAWVT